MYIQDIKKDNTIGEDAHLVFEGIISSLEMLQLIVELEWQFGVKISIDAVLPDNFDTIDAIAKLIERLEA